MQTTKTDSKQNLQKQQTETDIINIILEDHKPLWALTKVMKDSEESKETRFSAFEEFAVALVAHAKPEEQVLYTVMKQDEELLEESLEGEVEHGLADQLIEEIKRTTDKDLKSARVKVLAELVEHHLKEEEEDQFPDFKKNSDKELRAKLGNEYLAIKLKYLAKGDENIIPDPKLEKAEAKKH